MTTRLEQAQNELAAAQRKLEALSKIPQEDKFSPGTVIRWKAGGTNEVRVAVKQSNGTWRLTGVAAGNYSAWHSLMSFWSTPLDYWEIAPDDWTDGRVQAAAPPNIIVARGGYRLTDLDTGVTWERSGDDWVQVDED